MNNTSGTDISTDTATMIQASAGATGSMTFRQTLPRAATCGSGGCSRSRRPAGGGSYETAIVTPGALTLAGQAIAGAVGAVVGAGGLTLAGQAVGTAQVSPAAGGITLAGQATALRIAATLSLEA